ncbi:hypothetical protein HAX54_017732 [Datura stramonium]|uniref:Uncharacterized protein n=1 Tax=Datura stramonium TaxID=4076 RepID=A0ABS8S146_DATST|nr:hypothetical protein [Datura stramonium]
MAESFLFNIIERVLAKVSSIAIYDISLAWNVKTELRKLQSTLSTIKAVLLDANKQQGENHEVRDWLEKLRDVVYDVDDLMDDLSTQLLLQTHFQKTFRKKVRKFFSSSNPIIYRFKTGRKVKEIRELLNEIADDRKSFHFTEYTYLNPAENASREQTHSFVRASDIIGRDADQENIVKQLIDSHDEENISVIPIVGLGGLGKTTLSVAGAECLNVKPEAFVISERVRHLFFHAEDMSRKHFPRCLLPLQKLRSFSYSFNIGPVNKFFVKTMLSNFKCLRMLVLNNLDLEDLPSSIGHLKELRYLNLSDNGNIKFLPRSMSKLVNLQTLNLINCEQLEELPRDFAKLIGLKTLYLTTHQISAGIKNQHSFTSLQFLLLFKCCFPNLQPELVQHFTALRVLRIYECPSLCSLPSSIRYLTSLEKLWIWNCEELDLMDGEGMSGLSSLRSLLLMGLPKLVTLPLGLRDTAPATLKYFRIADCPNMVELPEWLQNYSSLQRLYIEDCPVLASIPQGIYNHNANVHIIDCPLLSGGC